MQHKLDSSPELASILRIGIVEMNLQISDMAQQKMLEYLNLLVKWNKVYNLTAIRSQQQMVINHLLDSLSILPYLYSGRWLDVGCGAGLPGLILAIAQPTWQFTLLDSNSKKTSFVKQAIIELGLDNVKVHCCRVEEFGGIDKFDGIVSRAFTELGDFINKTNHLIQKNGCWAAMKGISQREIATIPADCEIINIIEIKVPGLSAARSLVIAKQGAR